MNTPSEFKAAISLLEAKIKLNNEWLVKNTSNAYRSHVHRDNRELEVQLNTKRFNLSQVQGGKPSHGDAMPEDTKPHININQKPNI